MTLKEIGEVFNVDRQTVLNYMRRHGIPTRSKAARVPATGENHSQWKGGRFQRNDGYIYAIAYNHPAAHNNYVLEHRLVMEKHIGRYLEKHEIVHHINRIRDDNRIENLEIMNSHSHTLMHNEKRDVPRGWKLSEETKRNMSIARFKYWESKRSELA